ncbi:MAG: selenocysteine-specific translation elongation factor [Actinomycetota bacterium]
MPIIGTAGHVDHGKSTLVHALTGRDPDRWAEEKARGLTIDLGFAWARLGGREVGFVDVPGHERFIKNMLAGIGGLNVALLVVAADEGWMPQSEEHLAVLDLLGIEHGVVALTRIDLADEELIELSRADVTEHTEGTVAAAWPVIEVAAPAGVGLESLAEALVGALDAAGPPPDVDRPRMWIDRAFTIAGAGAVVTGTLVAGPVSVDDRLQCYPGGEVRVRGIQSHETSHDTLGPGTRAALNVAGVDRASLDRGTLLAAPGSIGMTERFLAVVNVPTRSETAVDDRGAYHVHVGTATVPARIRIIGDGPPSTVIVTTTAPLPIAMGDRFILRDTGRRRVVAGGTVLDPAPDRKPSADNVELLAAAVSGPREARADALVDVHGEMDDDEVGRSSGGGTPTRAISVGGLYFSHERFERRSRDLANAVGEHHERYPLRAGLPKSEAASRLGTTPDIIAALASADPGLVEDGPVVRGTDFTVDLGPDEGRAWETARGRLSERLAVPRASELGLPEEVVHALIRRGDLVRVGADLVFLPDQLVRVTEALHALPDGFTVAQFRDTFELTRRQAVPLLEWLDAEGWTRRRGDGRSIEREAESVRRESGPSADDAPSR